VDATWGRGVASRRGSARTGVPVAGVAVAGVVVGHLITYLLLVPRASARAMLLRETGHAYLPAAVQAALLVAVLSLGSWLLRTVAGRHRSPVRPSTLFGRLARLQLAGFAAMEVVERLASGTPLVELVRDHVVIGFAVQLLVAWLAARLLTALTRAAEVVRRAGVERRPERALVRFVFLPPDVGGRLVHDASAARAPPSAVSLA
jgi:hypothetical protein